jgi:hypothetical protein
VTGSNVTLATEKHKFVGTEYVRHRARSCSAAGGLDWPARQLQRGQYLLQTTDEGRLRGPEPGTRFGSTRLHVGQ